MENKLFLENYLLILKSTVEVYIHGTIEASNKENKDLLKESLNTILASQEACFNLMTKYNYYKVTNEDSKVIKNTLNKLTN